MQKRSIGESTSISISRCTNVALWLSLLCHMLCTVGCTARAGHSKNVVIAHGFLLRSSGTHRVSLLLIGVLVILKSFQQLVYDRLFKEFAKHRYAYEGAHHKFAARELEKMNAVHTLGCFVSFFWIKLQIMLILR